MSETQTRCTDCKHCGMDMELEPYCAEPTKVVPLHRFGLYVNHARRDESLCGREAKLFEARK